MADLTSSPPPQKLSRYRSQRKQAQQTGAAEEAAAAQNVQQQSAVNNDDINRSKSRYRRRPSNSNINRPATASEQDPIGVAGGRRTGEVPTAKPDGFSAKPIERQESQRYGSSVNRRDRHGSPSAQLGALDSRRRIDSAEMTPEHWNYEEERRQRLNQRYSVQHGQDAISSAAKPAPQISNNELFPPPQPRAVQPAATKVQVDGPPTSDQIRATQSTSALRGYSDDDDDDAAGGCFGLFKRKRGETSTQIEKMAASRPSANNEPPTIRPGGGGIVPGTDAPVSAVNAGDRQVLVECGKSKALFPVTPTTTPVDIMKSAMSSMSERIDVNSAVLIESFSTVGVQRPLRRYERVRDVMNSWDTDRQNSLILVDPGTGSSEAELSLAGVPIRKPGDESWFMFFSQKVGKWDKRLITLKSDGQITAQKDPDKPKDLVTVCHLSDFDIYTPTREKTRKKIKPPKKVCFAVKSQQKTSMFESTHDFVHFFCTNDRATADDFYAAVQGWRSWYLVNVMGEGREPKTPEDSGLEKELKVSYEYPKDRRTGNSMDTAYQLGSFKPMIEAEQSGKRPGTGRSVEAPPPLSGGFTKSSNQFDTTISPERRTSSARRKQNPPNSMNTKPQLADDEPLANLGRRASTDRRRPSMDQTKASPEEFLTAGLLGRSQSQRQREYIGREAQKTNAFTNAPNLLNTRSEGRDEGHLARRPSDATPRRTHSKRVQHANQSTSNGDLQRSSSRAKDSPYGKPLVDLTPQYREPPQHLNKGRGYHPENIGPGRLIDAATSPEDLLGIPPSTDWRGRNASASPLHPTNSLSRDAPGTGSVRRPVTSSREPIEAFTGEGLVAGSQGQSGWGGEDRGRGVIDGTRARGPMVDLHEPSKFVPGSLLNEVEHGHGVSAPVIDRSREDD